MKSIWIIDWLLIATFILMIISKIMDLSFIKIVQVTFFVLIIIHILQHWKIIVYSFKSLFKK